MERKGGVSPNDHEKVRTRLPPGFRFDPTDQELVLYYLKPKVLSLPLPASDVIPEICLKKYDPWDLPGAGQGERYFFDMLEANYRRNNKYRLTNSGYWKVTSKCQPVTIRSDQCNRPMATKRVLTFYIGRPTHGSRTNWMMHEYCLMESNIDLMSVHQKRNTTNDYNSEATYWSVCRIFEKNKQHKKLDLETLRSSSSRDRALTSQDSRLRRQPSFQSDQVSTVSSSSCITCSSDDDQVEQGSSTCTSINPLNKSFN